MKSTMYPVRTYYGFEFGYEGKDYRYALDIPQSPNYIAAEILFENLDDEDRKIFKDFRVQFENGELIDVKSEYSSHRELQLFLLAEIRDALDFLNILAK